MAEPEQPAATHEPVREPARRGDHPAPAAPRRRPSPQLRAVAAVSTLVAHTDAARAIAAIRVQAALRRVAVLGFLVQRRVQVAAVAQAVVARVLGVFARATALLYGQVLARAMAVRSAIVGVVTRAMAIGIVVAASIRAIVASLTGTVRAVVSRVTGGISALVRSVPIPDLPIANRVRGYVVQAAERVTGAVKEKVGNVLAFAENAVARVVGLALRVFIRLGVAVIGVVNRIVNVVTRIVATITARLATVALRVVKAVGAVRRRVDGVLQTMSRLALRHILRAERTAVAAVQRNRSLAVRTVVRLLRSASDDDPEDGAPLHPAEVARRRARDGAVARAMAFVVRLAAALNAKTVFVFQARTGGLVSVVLGVVSAYVAGIRTGIELAVRQVVSTVSAAFGRLVALVTSAIRGVVAGVVALASRVAAAVGRMVRIAVGIVRGIFSSFGTLLNNVLQRIRTFVNGLIDRVIRFLTRGAAVSTDTSEVTAGAAAYSPASLKASASAAFAAPAILPALGAIVEALAAIWAFIAGLELAVLLWWVGLIVLILVALAVIIYLVYRALNDKEIEDKIKDKPTDKPVDRPKDKPDPKEKPDPRKPKPDDPPPPPPPPEPRPQKPWFWDPKPKVAKAAIRGAVDARTSTPVMHYEAHHCWPEYVGGHKDQPLMGARYSVHRTIHDGGGLHAAMAVAAASSGFVLSRTTAGNAAFIAHMRGDKGARDRFSAALFGYYASLNAITDPPIPPPAYAPGIAYSYARV